MSKLKANTLETVDGTTSIAVKDLVVTTTTFTITSGGGYITKFGDGTMMVTGRGTYGNAASSSIFFGGVGFSGIPTVIASHHNALTSGQVYYTVAVRAGSVTESGFVIAKSTMKDVPTADNIIVSWYAHGRWK